MYILGSQGNHTANVNKLLSSSRGGGMTKTASAWSYGNTSAGIGFNSGPVMRMAMKPFSPLYQESNLMLPKDRKTMNAYNRHYYETDYWVGNAIDLHTYYPLGGFEIVSKDKQIDKIMNKAAERVDLFNMVLGVGLQYWMYGEAFPFLEWDSNEGLWNTGTIFNPDLIEVRRTIFSDKPIISLIPDSELKRVVSSTHPADIQLRNQIPDKILDYVLKGENIPLNYRNVSHISRKTVFHDVRGTSIIQRVWKELMLRDAFREVLFVMAQNHVTPLKIFKVGGKDKDYYPTDDELSYWQGIIEEAQNDPNYSIITHDAFEVQYVGASGQVLDVVNYLKLIEEHILTGLFISKLVTTGEGPNYANASVAYEILQKRYTYFRNVIKHWLINKVFLPISIAHDFKDNAGNYRVPQVKFHRMDFNKDEGWRRILQELNAKEGNKLVSDRTLITEVGLDYDDEQELITKEKIAAKVKKKHMEEVQAQADAGGLGGLGGGGGMDLGGGIGGGGGMPDLGGAGGGLEGLGGGMEGGLSAGELGAGGTPPAPEGGAGASFTTPAV